MTTVDTEVLAGVDIGGSKIAVLIATRDLEVRGRYTLPTQVGDPDRAAEAVAGAVEAALDAAGATRDELVAIGVGVPGRVDPLAGTVSMAVNLGWEELPLGPRLEALTGVPVALENDVRAAASGLVGRRVLGDVVDLAYLSIGTGISAGVVLDGRLHRGPRGLAGEIGHVVVEPAGRRCPCGLRGCLETVAAGPAIARQAVEAIAAGRASALRAGDVVTASAVYEAAAAGDKLATEITVLVGAHLARAVHELVMTYDVEVVVLGGGVAGAGQAFIDPILSALDAFREASRLAREVLRPDVVHLLPPDAEAGAWGAVGLARTAAAGGLAAGSARREVGDA
jgi:glucokinase